MNRQEFLKSLGLSAAGAVGLSALAAPRLLSGQEAVAKGAAKAITWKGRKMNVLFLPVDDLRPQLGCYGHPQMLTPNLDRLAKSGTLFMRAYCQQAVCSPSRTSLLTGCRPDTTQVYDLVKHFRTTIPDVITLPQHFKNNGYFTRGMGKVYHGGLDDPISWSVPFEANTAPPEPQATKYGGYFSKETKAIMDAQVAAATAKRKDYLDRTKKAKLSAQEAKRFRARGPAYEQADVPDDQYQDGAMTRHAIEVLKELKGKKEPFFLAVGFHKPHLPFVCPKKYWDLYKHEEIPLADNPYHPKGAPEYALVNSGELRSYYGIPATGPIPDDMARNLVHAYYACVSFHDAQVGRLLDELDRLQLRDNTIVVLWGDHGWKLGDHGEWCKHTNVENDTNAPLIVSVPGQPNAGAKTNGLVEFVDIYPSLAELCGLSLPPHLEGVSFAPVIEDPRRPWKKAAFSQYPRAGKDVGSLMGYAMRTDQFRYVEWRQREGGKVVATELYDHAKDPKENVNVADDPKYAGDLAACKSLMKDGWRGAKPQA